MKVLVYNDRAHRPTCGKVSEKAVLTPIEEAVSLTPATCCHPERLASWKEIVEGPTPAPTPEPVVETTPEPEPTPDPEPVVTVQPTVVAKPEEPAAIEIETKVKYPDTLARHFFRALVKVGGGLVAGELGVPYHSRGVEFCAFLGGKNIANLDTYLPNLWIAADAALKEWRKTSPAYLAFDLSNKEEAKQAFEAEQDFLIDFCAANTINPHRKNTPGFKAGADWRVL